MKPENIVLIRHNIRNSYGDSLRTDIRYRDDGKQKPFLIICHSFMAFKNWGFFPYLSESLAEAGYVSVIFNFALNGVREDDDRITEFDRFALNSFTRELEDAGSVLEACANGMIAPGIGDPARIGVLGHSRGGGIAILTAARDNRISALVSLASIATFDRWNDHQKQEWRKLGYLPLSRDPRVSPLRLGMNLLFDIENNAIQLDLLHAASVVTCPWLIVHGKTDVTVPFREAEALYRASRKTSTTLKAMEHVGHLFNAATYQEDGYRVFDTVVQSVVQFFQQSLQGEL